jgi:hypothetical protein
VEDIRASERDQFLFRSLLLWLATCAHVQALLEDKEGEAFLSYSQAREERVGMHLIATLVLLPAGAIYCGTQRNTIRLSNVLLAYSDGSAKKRKCYLSAARLTHGSLKGRRPFAAFC